MERKHFEQHYLALLDLNSSDVKRAIDFAKEAHNGMTRRYSGAPYIVHPVEVSYLLSRHRIFDMEAIVAGLLHDTVEDTDVTFDDIEREFGFMVASHVYWVTKTSNKVDGDRSVRKEIDRQHMARGNAISKSIKVADCLSNTRDLWEHDQLFARVYVPEIRTLLDESLRDQAFVRLVKQLEQQLRELECRILEGHDTRCNKGQNSPNHH